MIQQLILELEQLKEDINRTNVRSQGLKPHVQDEWVKRIGSISDRMKQLEQPSEV